MKVLAPLRVDACRAWLHEALAYAPGAELTPERKGEIYLHYDTDGTLRPQILTLSHPD
jgi:hypothetical protein